MKTSNLLAAIGLALAASKAHATVDPRDSKIDQLEAQVQALEAQNRAEAAQVQALAEAIAALRRAQDVADQSRIATLTPPAPPKNATLAIASLTDGKPVLATPDKRFSLTLHGIMQFDAGHYSQDPAGQITSDLRRSGPALGATVASADLSHARLLKDGDVFRRARFGFDGTAYGDVDYRLILDFGSGGGVENSGQLYEAWVQYSGLKPFKLRVGAFPPSIGLEDQGSTNALPLLERSATGDIARGFVAGDTRTAVQAFANTDHWLISAALTGRTIGVINTGTASPTAQTYGDQLGLVWRAAATPLYGPDWRVHIGAHGSYLITPANTTGPTSTGAPPASPSVSFGNTAELRIDSTRMINTGNISARHADEEGLEFAFQKRSVFLQSEYEYFHVQRSNSALSNPHFRGWYVEGGWVLTGEARKYNPQGAAFDGPAVRCPFDPRKGAWGAWEMVGRYSDTNLNYHLGAPGSAPGPDEIRGGELKVLSGGINWYWNPLVRFMFDYQHVKLDRLSPDATLYQTPVGAQIGQSYDVVSVRSQFAF